jgi:hypothetical protein
MAKNKRGGGSQRKARRRRKWQARIEEKARVEACTCRRPDTHVVAQATSRFRTRRRLHKYLAVSLSGKTCMYHCKTPPTEIPASDLRSNFVVRSYPKKYISGPVFDPLPPSTAKRLRDFEVPFPNATSTQPNPFVRGDRVVDSSAGRRPRSRALA